MSPPGPRRSGRNAAAAIAPPTKAAQSKAAQPSGACAAGERNCLLPPAGLRGTPDAHSVSPVAAEDDDSAAQSSDECSDADVKNDGRPAKRMRLEPAEASGKGCDSTSVTSTKVP